MAIRYASGSLSEAPEDIIAHVVDNRGKANSPIALGLQKKFFGLKEMYNKMILCNDLGAVIWYKIQQEKSKKKNRWIANMIAHDLKKLRREPLFDCLNLVEQEMRYQNLNSVAFPVIGNENWPAVERMIAHIFVGKNVTIYRHRPTYNIGISNVVLTHDFGTPLSRAA